MNLQEFAISRPQAEEAFRLLSYQPFVIDEERHVGVADSWLHAPDPTSVGPEHLRFEQGKFAKERYAQAYEANRRLAAMYDDFAGTIAELAGTGSYLDFGCNSGYLPVRVSLLGVHASFGCDWGDFSACFRLLNEITGSSARFFRCKYDSESHQPVFLDVPVKKQFEVVSSMAFLCHLPDPLHFVKALAHLATRAIFVWTGVIESNDLLIRYNAPNQFGNAAFPNGFDNGTSVSAGLLKLAMMQCGFRRCEELAWQPSWLPTDWTMANMPHYQTFKPLLFLR